jgi:arylsulfatase A-like enzyme
MTRRDFLIQGSTAAALAAALPVGAAEAKPPNLLLIHTDQQSLWTLSCYAKELTDEPNYGEVLVETPHADRLGKEGARLTNFFTNSAVCTPSRGCLLTGRYPHSHGAYTNNLPLNRDEQTIALLLQGHGYDTGYAGKWHLDGPPKPGFMTPERSMGFQDCAFMFNRGHWKKMEDTPDGPKAHPYRVMGEGDNYTTDWLANKTIDFIRKPRKKPFFYTVSIPDPHGPITVRPPYMTMYKPEDMVIPKTFPGQIKGRPRQNEAWLRMQKARYCGLVKCIDDNVGRIIAALKERKILDDTVIVFTADHGEYMGEHGLMNKNQYYRGAYRLPFLIRWPGHIPAGLVLPQFTSNVDIQSTLLELLGFTPCGREQGKSFLPLLQGKEMAWTNEVQIHHSSRNGAAISTPEYELILRRDTEDMLFDRQRDPEQTKNLAEDPEHDAIRKALTAKIIAHHRETESPALAWLTGEDKRPQEVGIVFQKELLDLDTLDKPKASFTRLLTTPRGTFRAGSRYRLTFDFESHGLKGDEANFYFTLRPGNDRSKQTGPLKWTATKGEKGTKEHVLDTGKFNNYVLILGIYRQGHLTVRNLKIERLP